MAEHDTNTQGNDYQLLNEKLQVRGQNFVALLRCPATGAPLMRRGEQLVSEADDSLTYALDKGLVKLVTPQQAAEFATAESKQAAEFEKRGWQPPPILEFRRLPQTPLTDWPAEHWQARANATAEMWRVLEAIRLEEKRLPIGPMGTAVDLSNGMGWLGYGLDVSGYNTIVLSEKQGRYGLGVFPHSRYMRVLGSLQAPPLAPNSFDLVTFSFSLQSIASPEDALRAATALLKKRGTLIVLTAQNVDRRRITDSLEGAGLTVQTQAVQGLGNPLARTFNTLRSVASGGRRTPPLIIGRNLVD